MPVTPELKQRLDAALEFHRTHGLTLGGKRNWPFQARVVELYCMGLTYREIGARVDLSKDRVRCIIYGFLRNIERVAKDPDTYGVLGLPCRALYALRALGLTTKAEVRRALAKGIDDVPNVGKKSIEALTAWAHGEEGVRKLKLLALDRRISKAQADLDRLVQQRLAVEQGK